MTGPSARTDQAPPAETPADTPRTASAPPEILELVERFRLHQGAYRSGRYNETQLRREFVDPLFTALGWDVDNTAGYAEAYKDVIHEDALKVGGSTKAPDYSFRVGGARKFFVETKKPSINLKDDPSPAFQLRRYAWSAKLPLSILTDFEELAVYNCRVRPEKTDKASKERVLYVTSDEYAARWPEIADVFSREAILRGSFDRYAESKKKRGTAEVDEAFLKEIEAWREKLARNLALRNPGLAQRELNYAVQKTIDRIIFLRICEDRGIERADRLKGVLNGPNVYPRLCEVFVEADVRYNSGLFHFSKEPGRPEEPDEWTLSLKIDDGLLREIISHLYYPDSPYEFSVLPADILGQVYEQFLGKVIRLTKGHRAVVEDKPEVKKAGGVYYTPTYIVDYIVENTVGQLLGERGASAPRPADRGASPRPPKTPYEVAARTKTWKPSKTSRPLAVLDPACGSGSFLIGAYQYLLDWYRDWYTNNAPDEWLRRKEPTIYEAPRDDPNTPAYRLTTAERKRILLDHIYGVDIDPQAVEVTKLSLLLKVLEGENRETLQRQLFAKERALPDLANNIKCGNSLIGPDFYRGRQPDLFDEDELLRINAFDWQAEFPEIMGTGGFDAVIGNPPYVLLQTLGMPPVFEYLSQCYQTAAYKIDTYHVFLERASRLARNGGCVGKIVPNTFLRNKHALPLRQLLASATEIRKLVLFDFNVFSGASVDTCVIVFDKTATPQAKHHVEIERWLTPEQSTALPSVLQSGWQQRADLNFDISLDSTASGIIERMRACSRPLGEFATAYFGIQTYDRKSFVDTAPHGNTWRPALDGGNIGRYSLTPPTEWVDARPETIKSGGKLEVYERERIGVRQIGRTPVATLLPGGWYSLNTIYNVFFTKEVDLDLRFILGILSSRLVGWYWELCFFDQKRTFPKIKKAPLLSIPIPAIDFSQRHEKERHDRVVALVERLLALHGQRQQAKTHHQKTALKRQIEATDREINRLVYELYGLTDDEIRLVEEAT